jgi:hypothetical protein
MLSISSKGKKEKTMKKIKEIIGKRGKGEEKVINDYDVYYDKANKDWLPLPTSPIPHSLKYAFPQSFLQVAWTINHIMGGRPNYFQFKMSEPSGDMHH